MNTDAAIVFGATGGIGAALINRLLQHASYRTVIGFSRRPCSSLCDRLAYYTFEPKQPDQAALRASIDRHGVTPRTVIVATGGLDGDGMFPEKNLGRVTAQSLLASFNLNAILPLMLVKACLPVLKPDANILVLSAKVGSIDDNRYGGWYGYRMSKSALNMGMKTLAIELARRKHHPNLLLVHPGTTRTEMSSPYLHSDTYFAEPDKTADRLLELANSELDQKHGQFVHWDGSTIRW